MKLISDSDDKIIEITDKDGDVKSFEDIKAGGAITLTASADLNCIKARISDDAAEGTLEEMTDDFAVINGTKYNFSYAGGRHTAQNLKVSDIGKFVLDYRGRLVGRLGGKSTEGYIFGYCMAAGKKSGLQDKLQLKLISSAEPRKEVKTNKNKEISIYYFIK